MMSRRRLDMISAGVLFVLGLLVQLQARTITSKFRTSVDSGFFPEIVSAMLMAVAVFIFLSALGGSARNRAQAGAADRDGASLGRVAGSFGLLVAYAAVLPIVGFLGATAVFLFAQLMLLAPRGGRNAFGFGLAAVIGSVLIYLTFTDGFGLMLPRGAF